MKKPIRLLYVTYNENPVGSGILRVQVRKMLEALAALDGVEAVRLVSFVSPRLKRKQQAAFDNLTKELQAKGVEFSIRLMPAASAWGWPTLLLMPPFCLPALLSEIAEFRPTVLHSRSYAAGWLAHKASKNVHIPHLFDPRGPYPEEMVQNGLWKEHGLTYRLWKNIEGKLIRESAGIIGVTPVYRDEFVDRGSRKAVFIPNRCDLASFPEVSKPATNSDPIAAFVGEMDSKWYAPAYIGRHFLNLRIVIPNLRMLVVTRRDASYIRAGLQSIGVPDDSWEAKGAPPEGVPAILGRASIGLVVQDFSNAWPVKFAEYLASGLPIVINERAGKLICSIVESKHLGVVIDIDKPESYLPVAEILNHLPDYSKRCRAYALKRLGIDHTARQYRRVYRSISGA